MPFDDDLKELEQSILKAGYQIVVGEGYNYLRESCWITEYLKIWGEPAKGRVNDLYSSGFDPGTITPDEKRVEAVKAILERISINDGHLKDQLDAKSRYMRHAAEEMRKLKEVK